MASRGTIYTTPGVTQQRFESLLAKNYIGIGQVVGEELTNKNIKDQKQTYKQQGTEIVLFRYKIRLCTKLDDTTPNDQVIFAFGQNNGPSGKGGFYFGNWRYADGEFVEVYQHPVTGLYYIDNSVPVGVGVTLTQNRNGTRGCQPLSGYKPGSPTFQVSLANQGSRNGAPVNEVSPPHTGNYCKWDELYENMPTIELKTPCEPSSMAGMPKALSGLLKDVQNLRTGLLGKDSFLVTSQQFIDQSKQKVDNVAAMMTGAMSWLIQEIRKQVMRKVNTVVNTTIGAAYLNTRYDLLNKIDDANKAINCAFTLLLDSLAKFVADALNNFINDILDAVTCAIENFLSNLLSQVVNGILNAISGILGGIGNIIGATIGVIDTILGVVESLLNIFEGCPPKQICPADKEWNFLEGVADVGNPIDIKGVFSKVNSSVSAFTNLGQAITDFPSTFNNFNFNFDANSALASAGGCFVGPSPCGPPVVRFFGGGAIQDALGKAVVSSTGEVMGIQILDPGSGYTSSPMVVINDPCGIGVGARAIAEIGPVGVASTSPGGGAPGGPVGGTPPGTGGTGGTGGGSVGLNTNIPCDYSVGQGYNGPGIYLDLTSISSAVNVSFFVTKNAANTNHKITIPGVRSFDKADVEEPNITLSLNGGKIYGPCTVEGGTLYVGNQVVPNISGSGTLSDTCLVIEEGGDDWNDFILRTGRGKFINLVDCSRGSTPIIGVTTAVILSTGYDYLPAPDGSKGANGTVYTNRCQTLVQRVLGTWDQPYNPGDVITLETGDRISLPAQGEIEIGNATLPMELTKIGAYIVKINPPLATVPYRSMIGFKDNADSRQSTIKSMIGFDDSPGGNLKPNQFGYANDYPAAKKLGFSDADIRYYLENQYKGKIGLEMQKKLNDPTWGKEPPSSYGLKSMIGFDSTQYGLAGFGLLDLEAARRKGFTDADVRYFLTNDYKGIIGPRMQELLRDPNWGKITATTKTGTGWFSMEDYNEAKRQGFTDADVRFYLEKNYVGRISPRVEALLNDPNWGRLSNSIPVGYYGIKQMFGFDDSAGAPGSFGYERDYQEARRRGFSDADIRYYLENHYTGTIGPKMKEVLKDPKFGRIQGISNMAGVVFGTPKDMRGFSDVYGSGPGLFGNADYEEARRQGYSDADVRFYLENHYKGVIGARMRIRLNDPAWGRVVTQRGFSDTPGKPGAFGQLDYDQATRQNNTDDAFLNSDNLYEQAVQMGYTDADVRYYLENYYTGKVGPRMKARLDDPNWGRELPVIPGPIVSAPPKIKSMIGFRDTPGRKDEFSTADIDDARSKGYRDVDIRFYLENNYTGYIADGVRLLLNDPNWGRLGQTITVSVTAPGCPDDIIVEDYVSSSTSVVPYLAGAVIKDPGFGYNCGVDKIVVTPSNGAELEYKCVNGSISDVIVKTPGSGFTELPEITINTDTGYNAKIIPVLGFTGVTTSSIGAGVTSIRVVDCVGTIPPRRPLDVVPE